MSITLTVNGINYDGWKANSVTKPLESLSGIFDLGLTERWPGQQMPRAINPGDSCALKVDGELLITGFVDDVEPSFDAESHTLTVRGRDKAGYLVDCSAINSPGQWSGQTLDQIATALCSPFGIRVLTETDVGDPFK